MEIRHVETQKVVQQLTLPRAQRFIQLSSGQVFVSSDRQVWLIGEIEVKEQLALLTAQNQYDEAISVLSQINSMTEEERITTILEMKLRKSRYLFHEKREFYDAMDVLVDLNADPVDVITILFPTLVGATVRKLVSSSSDEPVVRAQAQLTTSLSGGKNITAPLASFTTLSTDGSLHVQPPTMFSRGAVAAMTPYEAYMKHKFIPIRSLWQHSPLQTGDEVTSMRSLIRYLTDMRGKLLKIRYDQQKVGTVSAGEMLDLDSYELDEALVVIDTTLLKAYLQVSESLVGALLRVPNSVDIDEAETLLDEKQKYAELVDLYWAKGLHRKALVFLKHRYDARADDLVVEAMVAYLSKLRVEHWELITEFVEPLLRSHGQLAMQVFIDTMEYSPLDDDDVVLPEEVRPSTAPSDTLPRTSVLNFLDKISPVLSLQYLEYLVFKRGDRTPEFHNKLVMTYLDRVVAEMSQPRPKSPISPLVDTPMESHRLRLQRFLERSTFYRADRILSRFPSLQLYQERAILLSRLGQHEQALALYVNKLQDFNLVEAYCEQQFKSSLPDIQKSRGIYLTALKVYLKHDPNVNHTSATEAMLRLLSRYGDRIDPVQAISLLPPDTPLQKLHPFCNKFLTSTAQTHHRLELQKNLVQGRWQSLRDDRMVLMGRRVVMTDTSKCAVCRRRLGGSSVFVVHAYGRDGPYGVTGQGITHVTCHQAP
jgi:tetratricopeptide (TPR) repeat protein